MLQSFCQRGVSNLFFLFREFAIFRIAETRSFFIHLIHILFSQNSKYEKKSFNSVTTLLSYHVVHTSIGYIIHSLLCEKTFSVTRKIDHIPYNDYLYELDLLAQFLLMQFGLSLLSFWRRQDNLW